MLADGATPSPPTSWAASSERMSPYMLVVTITSNVSGILIRFIAAESTSISLKAIAGCLAETSLQTCEKSPSLFLSTLDLCTATTFLGPFLCSASSNACLAILVRGLPGYRAQRDDSSLELELHAPVEALGVLAHDHEVDVRSERRYVG